MTERSVDLNADVGEWSGGAVPDEEALLFTQITSANVACGAHAGDAGVMRATVALARTHGVAVGAHPGFADREGFGRRELPLTPAEVAPLVADQVRALARIAGEQGVRLRHVKPHGALYNMAGRNAALADAIAHAVASVDRTLVLVGLRGSQLVAAAGRAGLQAAAEVFADRAYRPDGSLVPRSEAGAVIDDEREVVARVPMLARAADTICVHSDTPGAARLAARIRAALEAEGIRVAPLAFGG